ncbi:MAG: arginase family protein [Proteobacteria bacterium]|nr:arginase family protein [Pseudomonadota bacterium]
MTGSDADALHTPPVTFMGVPATLDLGGAKAAVLGVPFDCGVHPFRIGSRQGPQAIREQSGLMRRYNSEFADFDPLTRLGLVDRGNVRLTPGKVQDSFERIQAAAALIHDAGVVPIAFGGDGSISLPLVRAAARRYPGMVLLHVDAHTDAYSYVESDKYNTATQFTHAAEEQQVLASRSYHIGVRGTTYAQGVYDQTRALGYNIVTMHELLARGFADVLGEVKDAFAGRPVYLSWDMDVFDPSCAPGVCTPSWGGFSAREGIDFLRGLAALKLDIVTIDINTVSPPHDVQNMAAYLAAHVAYEGILALCRTRGLDGPGA